MNILFLPCRSVPFDHLRIAGGLEAVQYNIVKNLSINNLITYACFGDENFGPFADKMQFVNVDMPINGKFTTSHAHKVKRTLRALPNFEQYDAIIVMEGNKLTLDVFDEKGVMHKVRNIMATPLDPSVRGIVQTWNNAVNVHKKGGKNLVPTHTFKNLAASVYSKMNTRIAAEVIDFEYWSQTDIISENFYPPILIEQKPVVLESEGHIFQAQRFDNTFRKSNVAFGAMDLVQFPKIAFCPSKWAPGKKWLEKSWLHIDASREMIQTELSTAKVMINTCHNTGTVENGSLEAISKGVPVLQLVQKGYSHATFEYDPETEYVMFEEGEDVKSLTLRYAKALQNFEDTYEKRVARANKLYLKYNPTMYFAQWSTALS